MDLLDEAHFLIVGVPFGRALGVIVALTLPVHADEACSVRILGHACALRV